MKFVASRLSEGNKIFPAEIHIEENGIKVKIPGFLSGDTKFINYEHITSVDISTPMIGFSSITFYNQGNKAFAHGFKKEEAKQIKEAIDRGKANAKVTTINHNHNYANPANQQELQQQPVIQRIVEPQPIPIVISTHSTNDTEPVAKENNGMYSEQIEKLIAFALSDGELTEKEKQILFKKAEAAGIDLDEFEMVLDAKIFERQSAIGQNQALAAAPKSDKFGDVKKCNSCGAIVQSFSTKCSDCGNDFSNIEANASVQKLFRMLDEVESQRDDKVTAGGVIGGLFKNSIGGGALSNALGGGSKTDKRKKEIISSFPVPNTKNDILEFLSLAFPKATAKGNFLTKNNPEYIEHNEFVSVWKAKAEQIIMKARFAMKEDKKTLEEINHYANQLGIK